MLSKKHRLLRQDIEKIFKEGRYAQTDFLACRYVKNNRGISRFSVIVGQKVFKKAATRNRIKRQIREILRVNLEKTKQGYDIVVFVQKKAAELNFSQLKNEVFKLFQKINLVEY